MCTPKVPRKSTQQHSKKGVKGDQPNNRNKNEPEEELHSAILPCPEAINIVEFEAEDTVLSLGLALLYNCLMCTL